MVDKCSTTRVHHHFQLPNLQTLLAVCWCAHTYVGVYVSAFGGQWSTLGVITLALSTLFDTLSPTGFELSK